jgi:hypothetical protein
MKFYTELCRGRLDATTEDAGRASLNMAILAANDAVAPARRPRLLATQQEDYL